MADIFLKMRELRGTWVAQSVEHLTLDFGSGHDPRVVGFLGLSSASGSMLSMDPCLRFSLSPPCLSSAHALSLSLSK